MSHIQLLYTLNMFSVILYSPVARVNMKEKLFVAAIFLSVGAAIGLVVWAEYTLWTECRQTNSWFYCMRVLSK